PERLRAAACRSRPLALSRHRASALLQPGCRKRFLPRDGRATAHGCCSPFALSPSLRLDTFSPAPSTSSGRGRGKGAEPGQRVSVPQHGEMPTPSFVEGRRRGGTRRMRLPCPQRGSQRRPCCQSKTVALCKG